MVVVVGGSVRIRGHTATQELPATPFTPPPPLADEPVQGYDQLDDSAKGLIEAIQERQAYINAGAAGPGGIRRRVQRVVWVVQADSC